MLTRALCMGLAAVLVLGVGRGAASEVYVDNVIIVLDASGSMKRPMRGTSTSKMSAAKDALKAVLKQLPPSTHVGLLVFSAAGGGPDWVYPLGARDDQRLMAAIDAPRPGGGTPLGRYMKIGADRLLKARDAQFGYGSYRLLVVTDGEADKMDRPKMESYTPDIVSRGITIDVIGVDMAGNHTLATKVHSYRSANDPASLQRAVREVFAEVEKSRDDSTGEDAFEVIAPLPEGMAQVILDALAVSGNEPIGTPKGQRGAPAPTVRKAPSPTVSSPNRVSSPPSPAPKKGRSRRTSPVLVVVIVIVFVVLRTLTKRSRRR